MCDFELGKPDIKAQLNVPFYRVGYFLHFQSAAFGNQCIYTEFDTWTQDTSLLGVPIANCSFIKRSVNNLDIRDSNGRNETGLADGHIEFSAYNYAPGANHYDTTDDLAVWVNQGNYGCNGDRIHFSADAQRSMGTRYFKALRSMYVEKY